MSYEVANEDGPLGQFASGLGYEEFIAAVKPELKALKAFVAHGATEDVPDVVADLKALEDDAKDTDIADVAAALRELLAGQDLAIITNGVEPDEDAEKAEIEITGTIVSKDDAEHLVFGWASIVTVDGRSITDTQGDQIMEDTLERAAIDFVLSARDAGEMHGENGSGNVASVGKLVESVVFNAEKVKAMLASLHEQKIDAVMELPFCGWWIGFHISDAATWEGITSGKLKAFSIGGRGKREKLE